MMGKQVAKDCAEFQSSRELMRIYKRFAKQERLNIKLTLKDKELTESPQVRMWLKLLEKEIAKQLKGQKIYSKIAEAIALDYPLLIRYPDGKIEIVKDYHKKGKR